MRLFFILIAFCAAMLVLSMGFSIVWDTVHNKEVQWAQMSVFLGAITAFTTTAAWQKVQQKKIESNDNKTEAAA